ncbi:MAG: DUF4159 domain-containing protein [Pseudomonadota bacterium]
MLSLGPVAFVHPWLLAALLALPVIWWLIRALPPQARRVRFPAIRLLSALAPSEPPSSATPWWLVLLRLLMAALLILALAQPLFDPRAPLAGEGPVLIVIDNGWTAAPRWAERQEAALAIVDEAARAARPVILTASAPPPGDWPQGGLEAMLSPLAPVAARARIRALAPAPWPPARAHLAAAIAASDGIGTVPSFWIDDGVGGEGADALAQALQRLGPATRVGDGAAPMVALREVAAADLDFILEAVRPGTSVAQEVVVNALDAGGNILGRASLVFMAGAETAAARLALAPEARGDLAQLSIAGESHAGAVYLLDARNARPLVGILDIEATEQRQPLRAARFYLSRALLPYAALREGSVESLLQDKVSLLILPDVRRLAPADEAAVKAWVEAGGVLLRFAGPRLAGADPAPDDPDPLLPVPLRLGERAVGGALSWARPQPLGAFTEDGPFAGLVPAPDLSVSRQVLARPSLDLAAKTWARLADETPLVTADRRGAGRLVLFHTTANPDWSNLVLSGTFVEMLQRILPLARRSGGADAGFAPVLQPLRHLNGFGALVPALAGIAPIRKEALSAVTATPQTPPGYYGDGMTLAVNLAAPRGPIAPSYRFAPMPKAADGLATRPMTNGGRDLMPALLLLAAGLVLADGLVSLALRGQLGMPGRRSSRRLLSLPLLAMMLILPLDRAHARDPLATAQGAANIRLACVTSGRRQVDEACLAGLRGLSLYLRQRTSVWPDPPVLVRPEDDGLGLYPVLYWPILAEAPGLSDAGVRNLNRYLRHSGLILFDSGPGIDARDALPIDAPAIRAALQRVAGGLDIPSLAPLTESHVLAHSFYLLDRFPGRLIDRPVWVEDGTEGEDGRVSPVIIGGNDWAAAWGLEGAGTAAPLGLAIDRQRELAIRFGINVVMYALTGTYKADQVHLPALMDRLGR